MFSDDPAIIDLDEDALLFEDYEYEDDFGDDDYEEIIYEYEYEDSESPEIIVEYEYVDEKPPPSPPRSSGEVCVNKNISLPSIRCLEDTITQTCVIVPEVFTILSPIIGISFLVKNWISLLNV